MCKQCKTVEDRKRHIAHVSVNAVQDMPYHSPPTTSPKLLKDLKCLSQVSPGDIIYVLGRYLQPFCSNAIYRVRVCDIQPAGSAFCRIFGELMDFKDSPVNTYPMENSRLFRWESASEQRERINAVPKLSREDIERIAEAEGIKVRFREYKDTTTYVEGWVYLGWSKEKGTKTKRHSLGKLTDVAQMNEEDLASLVRWKFAAESEEQLGVTVGAGRV